MRVISIEDQKEALALLLDVLRIPTVNSSDNESKLVEYLWEYFKRFGIDSTVQMVDPNHANLIVDLHGENPEKYVVWNGHIDTVPYGNLEEWDTDPREPVQKEDLIIARGASDMKSGLAAMVYAICSMHKQNRKPKVNIRFIATCDEEKTGMGARKIMEENALGNPSALIIGEPTNLSLGIAQKGCIWLELLIRGKTSHSAYPKEGVNAVDYGFAISNELKEYIQSFAYPLLDHSTAEITMFHGGVANNMVPDQCRIVLDIRNTPNLTKGSIIKKLEKLCMEYGEKTNDQLEVTYHILNYRVGIETRKNNVWLQQFEHGLKESNLPVQYTGINYFTDGSIFCEKKSIPTILFGPGNPDMAHKPNERVNVNTY